MNILLTGGAGYIGSHIAYALKQAGHVPVTLDDLSHGHLWAVRFGPFVEGDIGDEQCIRAVCNEYKPKALIHCAALIEAAESVKQPERYENNNFHKATKLFETARSCGVSHVVMSSTAAVYGEPRHDRPLRETELLNPLNPYGVSKLAAEQALFALCTSEMNALALRYFNAAGAAEPVLEIGEAHIPESHLVPRIILAGLGKLEALEICGTDYPTPDGTAIRDYVHVMDLAGAHIAALNYLMAGRDSGVCNLGTNKGFSVLEVVAAVAKCMGCNVPVWHGQRRAGDSPRLVADYSRAAEWLGWQPKYGLKEIVTSAVSWHKSKRYQGLF